MRGLDWWGGGSVQLCAARGARSCGASAAGDPSADGRDAGHAGRTFRCALFAAGATVDPAGASVARDAAAGAFLRSVGTDAHGADRLQPAVPLVRGAADGRAGLASDGVQQEPRPIAGGRCGAGVPGGADRAAAGEAPAVGRALQRRRHADRRLGLDEELPPEGRLWASRRGRAATASATSAARSAPTRRTHRPPIRTPGSTARAMARAAGCASWAMP